MRFSVLASGSGGNACYVETSNSRIMIDAGLSCRELLRRMERIEVDPLKLDALLITHEHIDHIRGAGPLSRRLDIPVYINNRTLMRSRRILGNISRPVVIHTGQAIAIRDLCLETFTKCHDAVDPMGVIVSSNGIRLGLLTDLGRSTTLVEDRLRGCQALILEFNHDEEMLQSGPYPLEVKRRIKGQDGHLSNVQAGSLVQSVSHEDLKLVVLAHLSKINNDPQKALDEVENALSTCGREGVRIIVSEQDQPAPMVEFRPPRPCQGIPLDVFF
ncbi:MAG: MBL fold metallo-hydrolase [Deltaproteobacteria bacterium]|nr:MBL fold metallo-hydrolase [Deltaproteobacteria bacterium]